MLEIIASVFLPCLLTIVTPCQIMQAITVSLVMFNKVKIQNVPVITSIQISLMLCLYCCPASLLHT